MKTNSPVPLRLAALAALAVGGLFLVPGAGGLVVLVALPLPVVLMALGARHAGAPRWLGAFFALLALWLEAVAVALLMLRGEVAGSSWIGGLPAALAVQIYGLCLIPLPLVALAYALAFTDDGRNDSASTETETTETATTETVSPDPASPDPTSAGPEDPDRAEPAG
ncbi:MAG: hypothetical protein AAGC60_14580 [Acidobacteriota bacterium]